MPTSGPSADPERAFNVGVAAHITAASKGGPRYDPSLTAEQRKSIENAVWLCGKCNTMVDQDETRYPAVLLRQWKRQAEDRALRETNGRTRYRAIDLRELRDYDFPTITGPLRALSEEFGCEVRTNVQVPNDRGWLNLDAAVVRDEDELIAIAFYEVKGGVVPYFQMEYLIELGAKSKFPLFRRIVLLFAIVSQAPKEQDEIVKARLNELATKAAASVEVQIRMYRLKELQVKYNLPV